jgi:hypothetical protein
MHLARCLIRIGATDAAGAYPHQQVPGSGAERSIFAISTSPGLPVGTDFIVRGTLPSWFW